MKTVGNDDVPARTANFQHATFGSETLRADCKLQATARSSLRTKSLDEFLLYQL